MQKQTRFFYLFLLIFLTVFTPRAMARKVKIKASGPVVAAPVPMKIGPAIREISPDQEQEFKVEGGTPPYLFKTSAGLIRYSGNTATYISPSRAGEANISVKDDKGQIQTLVFQVKAP
jgi:hypothetical protein